MASETWVNFQQIKRAITIDAVLKHYGIMEKFTRKGDRLSGPCPVHKGSNKKQFSVDLGKNIWKCFSGSCGKGGHVIDLVAAIENVPFRDAALLLQGWLGIRPEKSVAGGEVSDSEENPDPKAKESETKPETSAAVVEKKSLTPLTFQLKVDPEAPYLKSRGLLPLTIAHFGLGLASKGSMAGRIAIPIHSDTGDLVGYAGRLASEAPEVLDAGEPRYKLPAGFPKGLVVFNLNRFPGNYNRVVLVEGFFSVFWLHQNGYPNVVSVMGSSISSRQVELLAQHFKGIQIFFDGDEAGNQGARKVARELAPRVWVRIVDCPEGLQPDRLPAHELKNLLGR